jgi:hypothetical protein
VCVCMYVCVTQRVCACVRVGDVCAQLQRCAHYANLRVIVDTYVVACARIDRLRDNVTELYAMLHERG